MPSILSQIDEKPCLLANANNAVKANHCLFLSLISTLFSSQNSGEFKSFLLSNLPCVFFVFSINFMCSISFSQYFKRFLVI